MIDRRRLGLGAVATLAAGTAKAAPDRPLFVSGPMSRNALAIGFKAPSASIVLPDTPLVSAQGPRRLSQLRGRTWLISLWAEWCAPCLQEATDLAAVARRHAGPSFGLIFVLTSSDKRLDLAGAQAVLAKRGAADAPLFVEPDGGKAVMNSLAVEEYPPELRAIAMRDSGASLPCNVLVDRKGRVRARSFGAENKVTIAHAGPMTEADKARALETHTIWATPAGDEFAAALAAGLLERS